MTPSPDRLIATVQDYIAEHKLLDPKHPVIVAVSGGVDSLVLLYILHQIGDYELHVATLDHGIRGAAGAADAAFVRQTADAWNLPVTVGRVDVPAYAARLGIGLEDAARRARYTFLQHIAFATLSRRIALAHNQDDQAETVLMHLIRGAGLTGLRGMLPSSKKIPGGIDYDLIRSGYDLAIVFQPPLPNPLDSRETPPPMRLIRPLLAVSRAEIEAYARVHNLTPREDATNTDPAYLRNRIRHEVIPLLETINPNLRATLARTADVLRDDAAWIDQHILTKKWSGLLLQLGMSGLAVDRDVWSTVKTVVEKRVILRALFQKSYMRWRDIEIGLDHIDQLIALMDAGVIGSVASLPDGLEARVEHHIVIVHPAGSAYLIAWIDTPALYTDAPIGPFSPRQPFRYDGGTTQIIKTADSVLPVEFVHEWTFTSAPLDPGADLAPWHADPLAAALSVPADAELMLRTRQPGDRWQPRGLGGRSQKLKVVLNSMQVPEALRDCVPLLTVNGVIAWFVAPTWVSRRDPDAARQIVHTQWNLALRDWLHGSRGRVAHPFEIAPDPSDEPALPRTESRIEPDGGANRVLIGVRWIRNHDL